MRLTVHPFFESSSGSLSFIVACPESELCAVIDPALGVDDQGNLNTDCADLMLDWIKAQHYTARWILETHVHADRPSAAAYLKQHLLCAQTAIGADSPDVTGYDQLLRHDDKICLGHACGRVIATPGHTPGCVSYHFDDFVFVGDTLFMPDTGTARCDFPGGCAHRLYQSIQQILSLPEETRLYVCHDYGGDGRRHRYVTTVAEEKAQNIHVGAGAGCDDFVRMRTERDAGLAQPRWANFSIPANMQCLPPAGVADLVAQSARPQ